MLEGFLLNTCVISALLNAQQKNNERVLASLAAFPERSLRHTCWISVAEISFGFALHHAASGTPHPILESLRTELWNFPVLEVSRDTSQEYAELRKNLAVALLPTLLKADRTHWIENWVDRATCQKLQVDENDVWICAHAKERKLTVMTTDQKMVDRMSKADPSLRFRFVKSA